MAIYTLLPANYQLQPSCLWKWRMSLKVKG